MPATVRVSYYGNTSGSSTEPAGANAESGIKFNREDTQTGTTPVPIPTDARTVFSWIKQLALEVTTGASTSISNRKVYQNSTPASGLGYFFKGAATFVAVSDANRPADAVGTSVGSSTPSGYTAMTGSAQAYDSASASASGTGRNGQFCVLVLGVDNTFAGGASSNTSLPDLKFVYDEA